MLTCCCAARHQEYDYHLAAVNTVTFVDEGRRFVTTSDDKTIRAWEFGIPVQIKYIADPSMHSVPAVTLHPNTQWFIGTSLDNQIVTYSAKDRFRQNRKKTFKARLPVLRCFCLTTRRCSAALRCASRQ